MSQGEWKSMPAEQFRDEGLLQEVNRQFFHPLGLALTLVEYEDGRLELGDIRETDDPEGIVFAEGAGSQVKARKVFDRRRRYEGIRMAALGYGIQPLSDLPEDGST